VRRADGLNRREQRVVAHVLGPEKSRILPIPTNLIGFIKMGNFGKIFWKLVEVCDSFFMLD
jgi:hypothetical protein